MGDWRGERESNGLCLCVKGKACWQCGKESLLDCWSSVEGCLPVPTPPGLADLRLCLCMCF